MLLISNGFVAQQSTATVHWGLAAFCTILHANVVCIALQFYLRYRIVCKQQ